MRETFYTLALLDRIGRTEDDGNDDDGRGSSSWGDSSRKGRGGQCIGEGESKKISICQSWGGKSGYEM